MSSDDALLSVIPIPGLRPNSLGNYLAALGLLKVLSRRWPDVRLAWRDGLLQVVGGPADLDVMATELMAVADGAVWTPYERGWADAQKASTKSKSSRKLALWQGEAAEEELELFTAHVAPALRVSFNPLLGSGGNAGKRAFADGWKKAVEALRFPEGLAGKSNKRRTDERDEALRSFLDGKAAVWQLKKLNAASWFSNANKIYNSGQGAFSDGVITPWAMVLACEGLCFFSGAPSRRLGTRARSIGAFPFVVAAASPETAGEAGRDRGEVWVPLWLRPMTAAEVATLFARGRAELAGRAALTPAAFAVAITGRGVDAGISEFRRFALGKTTSANTFESRYLGAEPVPSRDISAGALQRLLDLVQRLPPDRKKGQRWSFVGLRGPLEVALVRAAAEPKNPEAIVNLLDAAVQVLERVDVNRAFREREIPWEPLPLVWLAAAIDNASPEVELRLALSVVSSFPADYPFALYRFGIERWPGKKHRYVHPKAPPARWAWGAGRLTANLSSVLSRRLLDWASDERGGAPHAGIPIAASLADIERWLDGNLDEELLAHWLSRLALFDWSRVPQSLRTLSRRGQRHLTVNPTIALYGLLHLLFDLRPVLDDSHQGGSNLLAPESGARTAAAAGRVIALVRAGDVERAVEVARSRFAMAGVALMRTDAPWAVDDAERLLASLLFTSASIDRSALIRRWLRPQR